jgi:prevent-host-death family protein
MDLSGKKQRIIELYSVWQIPPFLRGSLNLTTSERQDHEMYNTEGVDSVATITELRSETSDLIEHVRNTNNGVLIQKNNEPHAVLISWETYKAVKDKVNLDEL